MGKQLTIQQLLEKHYPPEEYVLMAEVSDTTGFNRSRSADFIVAGLWASRGNAIIGIEVKSGRGDWLRELKNPKKQENHFKYCDQFYLLTVGDDIAKLEEIPDTWGWKVIRGSKIYTLKQAPKLTPQILAKGFVCSMLRRAADKSGHVNRNSIQDAIDISVKNAVDIANNSFKHEKEAHQILLDNIKEYEEHSGVKFNTYRWNSNANLLGKAVKIIVEGKYDEHKMQLEQLKDSAKRIHDQISKIITE